MAPLCSVGGRHVVVGRGPRGRGGSGLEGPSQLGPLQPLQTLSAGPWPTPQGVQHLLSEVLTLLGGGGGAGKQSERRAAGGEGGAGVRSLSFSRPQSRVPAKGLAPAGGNDVDNVRAPKNFTLDPVNRNQLAIDPSITQDGIPANFPAGTQSSAFTCVPPCLPR